MTPTFDPDVKEYTANVTTETSTITATAATSGATVVKKLNGAVVAGNTVTWTANTDTLTIEVSWGGVTKTYTVTVTHNA